MPDGTIITGEACSEVLADSRVRRQLKQQYNLAVATSSLVFELAARDYESAHAVAVTPRLSLATRLAQWFGKVSL